MNKKRLKPIIFLLKNHRGQNRSFSLCNFSFFPKNRRGSHVGAMLSFVIFITFLIFLYSILQPALKTEADKEDMVDYISSKLKENFTGELLTVTMEIRYWEIGTGKECIFVENIVEGIEDQNLNKEFLVIKNVDGSILPYFIEPEEDLSIKTGTQFDSLLKIYSSQDIDSSKCTPKTCVGTCYNSNEGYDITSVGQRNESFLKKARTFKTNYELSDESYEKIKENLKIPKNIEFGFELKTVEGESVNSSTKIPPSGKNVYVGEIPILYIDEQANLEPGFLTVKVW